MHVHVTRQREFYVTFFKSLLRIFLAEVILLVLSACCAVTSLLRNPIKSALNHY